MAKDNIFKLVSIDEIPIDFAKIPGLDTEQIDYVSSIGGVNAPEPGADKTSENTAAAILNQGALALLNAVDTAQIINAAITELKIASGAVSAAKTNIAAISASTGNLVANSVGSTQISDNAVTSQKIIANAIVAGKIASNAVTAVTIEAGAVTTEKIYAGAVTADKITVSTLSAITANIGSVTAGTLTGITVNVNGDALRVRDTSGNQVGYMYGVSSSIFRVFGATTSAGGGSVTMELDASSGYIKSRALRFHPYNDNESYLGGSTTSAGGSLASDKTWKYVGAQVVDAKDLYKLNDITVIDQSGTTIYVKSGGGGLVLQDGSTTIATFSTNGLDMAGSYEVDGQYAHLDCVVFANNSPLTENGAIYYNSSDHHFYGRCNGSWRQLDN